MTSISTLKAIVDRQFESSRTLLDTAMSLNETRLQFEADGRLDEAEEYRRHIENLLAEAKHMMASAESSGTVVAEAIRNSW